MPRAGNHCQRRLADRTRLLGLAAVVDAGMSGAIGPHAHRQYRACQHGYGQHGQRVGMGKDLSLEVRIAEQAVHSLIASG